MAKEEDAREEDVDIGWSAKARIHLLPSQVKQEARRSGNAEYGTEAIRKVKFSADTENVASISKQVK
jgi:hypothetical protein